ncbi:Gfo/Idh/MocA family protein [Pseudothermotoga thermarum]|uniref:Inositol 2-dehydrogenase n=1 Tax=Pseudothermotoga thermarum DSM 5069 TaxID=688269 RepID=F7YYX2_9THEM|nr:Gfo/Idh/MocA family oxidoreductase [Pseudothermotoga thermarum]AEH51166.1 Inositol 2-dehydrogenase [Pseudothermotoga thermarum DSM 5069]
MEKVKVGLVGAGGIGQVHLEILSTFDDVKIAGVMDIDESRARHVAEKYQARVYTNLKDMKNDGIDAVYITTPNKTHFKYAMEALELGFNVFCEKPMTTSLEEAIELEKKVKEKNAVFQLGHNRRFAYVYSFMKQKIESGELKPYSFQIKMNRGELLNPPWTSDRNYTGGFLYESTVHLFDMACWLFGDVEEMFVLGKKSIYPDYDDWAIVMKMKNGILGTFTSCAHASWMIPFERVEVYGEHMMMSNDEMEKVHFCKGLGKEVESHDYTKVDFKEKWGYVRENRAFIDCVKEHKTPPVTVSDGVRVIRIIDACYKAVESGNPHVRLEG